MTKSELIKRFGKSRLLDMSDELGLGLDSSRRAQTIVGSIMEDMDKNGIPEADDMSDDLFDILIALGYIDEEGNVLEDDESEGEKEEVSNGEQKEEQALPDKLPRCWGYGDKDDPACKRCTILQQCLQQKVASRPKCFGNAYSSDSEECDICLDWKDCQAKMTEN